MSAGQLILCGENEVDDVTYEPVNNVLHVGSQETANVVLSGLKNLAFTISIDNFGRVTITNYTKRAKINDKRIAKNVVRPLINGSTIELTDYKFRWKYNNKFSRSYSLSPCKKRPLINNVEFAAKNRKTMSCFALQSVNDENADENVPSVAANEEVVNFIKPTPAENDNCNVTASAKKRKSLLPVKENRSSELRRASIVRSLTMSDDSKPLQFITPKKPIPSATMVKSVNAILRSEGNVVRNTKRNTLGSTDFPNIVQKMNLFKVVTDEMKTVGPNKYIANKSSAANSPKKTPKKNLLKAKRLSLRSEVAEMGILKRNPTEGASGSRDAEPTSASTTKEIDDVNMPVENDVVQSTDKQRFGSSTGSSVDIYDNTMECLTISDEEDDEVISSDKIIKQESVDMFDNESSDSSFSVISVEDDSYVCGDIVTEENANLLRVKTPNNRTSEASDADVNSQLPEDRNTVNSDEFHTLNGSKNLVEGTPANSQSLNYVQIQEAEKSETIQTEEVKTSSEELLETLQEVVGTTLAISTPTKRQSLIRNRRNSRLCSLEQCCSPAPSTPSKIKLTTSVVSTPKSILKTPKPSKTPKKSVRILDTIFHEDEDETRKSTNSFESEAPKLNTTFDKGCENEIANLSVSNKVVASISQSNIEAQEEVLKSTNNSEAESQNMNTTIDKGSDNEVDTLSMATNDVASTSQSIIEVQKEVRKSTNNSEAVAPNLNTTFDKECENEIANLSVGNNVVASMSQSNIEARKSTSNAAAEETILNTTFDKGCDNEVENLSVANNVAASTSQSIIEVKTEVRKSTNNSAAEKTNLNTTFDKGCDNEVVNLSGLASTSQSNTEEQVRKSTYNSESETSTLHTTFDKGCDNEVDNLSVAAPTFQSNSEGQDKVRKSTNISELLEPYLNTTFDMENENEIDNLSVSNNVVASTSQTNENIVPEKSNEEQCNYTVKQEKDLTAVGEISVKTQETVQSIQPSLSDVAVKMDYEVSGTPSLMASSQSSGLNHELQLTSQENVLIKNHSNNGFSLDDNAKAVEPISNETTNLDGPLNVNTENVQSNESIDAQSNETNDSENVQLEVSSFGKANTSGLDDQCHTSDSDKIVNTESDSNTLSEKVDAVEPIITEITSEASTLNTTDMDMGCDNEINNLSVENNVTSSPQSTEELITVAAEMQFDHATTHLPKDENVSETENNSTEECENPPDKTNLIGMKELLNTPKHKGNRLDDLRGVKELVNTPPSLDKTNLVGMKELLNTPGHAGDQCDDMRGVKELMNTPKQLDKTNLIGMKELLQTPDHGGNQSDDLRGVKELMNTPKPHDKTNLVGMKELLNTPDNCGNQLDDMTGVKELLSTPKQLTEMNLEGLKEMVQTPATFYKQPDKSTMQSSSNVLVLEGINYSSRLSLVNKLNNALSELGLKVQPSASDPSTDNVPKKPQLELSTISEQHSPSSKVTTEIMVESEAPVANSPIVTESIPSKSIKSAKTVIEIPTSSKGSVTNAAISDEEVFKIPSRPTVNNVEKDSKSVRNRTRSTNDVDASKTMKLNDDKSSVENTVAHSSEKITVADNSKSSKLKSAKSTKDAKVTTTTDNTERNADDETVVTTTDEDEPIIVTRKRVKNQAVVENSKSTRSKDVKSTKDAKARSTRNTDRKINEDTNTAEKTNENTPKSDSEENVIESDATTENDTEMARKGSKKPKEHKSKKGTASSKISVNDDVEVKTDGSKTSKRKATETLKSVKVEHTPPKRNNRKAKQNTVDQPKEEIEAVNTRRLRKVKFVNEASGPIADDIGAVKTDKKTENVKTSAIQTKSTEMSVQNEPSKSTLKRTNRSAKTNVADEPDDIVSIDTVPEDSKVSDDTATSTNAETKKPIKSGPSNVPNRRRNAESVIVNSLKLTDDNHASSRTRRNMRSAKNTETEASTESSKKVVLESTAKSQSTRATTKRSRQASEVASDALESLVEKQPSKRSKRKNVKTTSSSSQSEANDVSETSTSSTATIAVPEKSQTNIRATVLTRRARKASESVESIDSIEVPRSTSRTRSKRNINHTAKPEDAAVVNKRPKRGNK